MDESEIARTGAPYKAAVTRRFGFLVDELGFDAAVDVSGPYRHALAYRHAGRNLAVVLANAYHPVDYGFEIALHPLDGPGHAAARTVVFHTLKEDQDRELAFLAKGPAALRKALAELDGEPSR